VEVKIAEGEICIRGPIVMREYFNRPDATRESLRDGWLHTGDLGRLDAAGRLYITGRLKEIIVLSSGKNLYPEEIEAHYRQSPVIKELCVLGQNRPGEPAAERLHAVIVPDQDALRARGIVNVRELVRFEIEGASVHLPPHKRILTYEIQLDALPRTTTGKLRRHEIARRLTEHAAVAEEAEKRPVSDADAAWLGDPRHAALVAAVGARMSGKAVRPDANLELDLGLDSMERVELLTALEQREGTRVAPDTRATIFTVRQLVDAVLSGATPADGDGPGAPGASELPWDTVLGGEADPEVAANLTNPKGIRLAVFMVVLGTFGLALRLLLRLRTNGREHLPAQGPFIISPNHQSFLDGFVLCAVLPTQTIRQLFFVGDAALFAKPLMRWLGRSINMVAVDPDANLVAAMKGGAAGLRLRKVLILFPEGERTIDGSVRTFRKGAAILSSHLDAPVVPVAMTGLYELWPRERPFNWRGLLPWRVTPVTIEFGAPIAVTRGAYVEGTAEIRRAVTGMLEGRSPDRPAG
jgi:long-chain acyl-CoA synthetase